MRNSGNHRDRSLVPFHSTRLICFAVANAKAGSSKTLSTLFREPFVAIHHVGPFFLCALPKHFRPRVSPIPANRCPIIGVVVYWFSTELNLSMTVLSKRFAKVAPGRRRPSCRFG